MAAFRRWFCLRPPREWEQRPPCARARACHRLCQCTSSRRRTDGARHIRSAPDYGDKRIDYGGRGWEFGAGRCARGNRRIGHKLPTSHGQPASSRHSPSRNRRGRLHDHPTRAVWNGPYARAAALPAVAATQTAANAGNAQLTTSQAASSDPTWVVDWNSGLTLSPNANDYVQDSASMDLRAQTQGATGATYSWNFSVARAQATSAALPATGCSSPGTSPTGTTSPILCNSQSIAPAASRC